MDAKALNARFATIDELLTDVQKALKARTQVSGAETGSSVSLQVPGAPTLEVDGTYPTQGNRHWLQHNYPYMDQAAATVRPKVVIRATLPSGILLENSIYAISLIVYDTTTSRGVTCTANLSSHNVQDGYVEFELPAAEVAMNDSCYCLIVAMSANGGYQESVYGVTDRTFIAGTGIPVPETPTITTLHVKPHHTKFKLTIAAAFDSSNPYTGGGSGLCNFYDTLEVYEREHGTVAYSASKAYKVGDACTNGGVEYLCTAATTGNAPPNASYWSVLAGADPDVGGASGWRQAKSVPLRGLVKKIAQNAAHNTKSFTMKHKANTGLKCAAYIKQNDGQVGPWLDFSTDDVPGQDDSDFSPGYVITSGGYEPGGASNPWSNAAADPDTGSWNAEEDLPGTPGKEVSARVRLYFGAAANSASPSANPNNNHGVLHLKEYNATTTKYRHFNHEFVVTTPASDTYADVVFKHKFKKGRTVTFVEAILKNHGETSKSTFSAITFVAGGGAMPSRPGVPTLVNEWRKAKSSKYTVTMYGGTANTDVRRLQLWGKANPAGGAPTDYADNPTGWTLMEDIDVKARAKAGATVFKVRMDHLQSERWDVCARFLDVYESRDTYGPYGQWSAVVDALAPPADDTGPTGPPGADGHDGATGQGHYVAYHDNDPSSTPSLPATTWDGTAGSAGANGWVMVTAAGATYNWSCYRKSKEAPTSLGGAGFDPATAVAWYGPNRWNNTDAPPSALSSVVGTSYIRDKKASDKIECDLTVVASIASGTWASNNITQIDIEAIGRDGKVTRAVVVQGEAGLTAAAYFGRAFIKDEAITGIRARPRNGKVLGAWVTGSDLVAGASNTVTPTPDTPTLTLVKQKIHHTKMKVDTAGVAWASGTVYATGDLVTSSGIVYRCTNGHTAASPTNNPPNASFWATAGALAYAISAISKASTCAITTASAHGLAVNDYVYVKGVVGMVQMNNRVFKVKALDGSTPTTKFTIKDCESGADIDSSAYTTYSSGGFLTYAPRGLLEVIEVYTAAHGATLPSTGTEPDPSVWTAEPTIDIAQQAGRGKTSFHFSVQHDDNEQPAICVKLRDKWATASAYRGKWTTGSSLSGSLDVTVTPGSLTVTIALTAANGTGPYSGVLDYGDGSTPYSGTNSSGSWVGALPTSHVYAAIGSFTLTWTITDAAGASVPYTKTITLTAPGALTLSTSATPTSGNAPLDVTFGSTVAGGVAPYTFAWNFGDNSTSAVEDPGVHTYAAEGSYTWLLVVTDNAGTQLTAGGSISVAGSTSSVALNPGSIAQEPYDSEIPYTTWYLNSTTTGAVPDAPNINSNTNCQAEDANYIGNPGGITKDSRPAYLQKFSGAFASTVKVRGIKVKLKMTAETDSKVYVQQVGLISAAGDILYQSGKLLKWFVPAAGGYLEVGNSEDTWGMGSAYFTEAVLEDNDFGVYVWTYCKATAAAKWVKIDFCEMTVYY